MKHAIVVFTRVPKAGETKTRLTTPKGGLLTPEEARDLYEACLLDVIDRCIASESGDLYICYNLNGDYSCLSALLQHTSNPQAIKGVFPDKGGSFDQCMQYAADYILTSVRGERRADSVLIVGGDLPSLQSNTIQEAVRKLEQLSSSLPGRAAARHAGSPSREIGAALVEASCQEGGFSLIGLTCTTPFNFEGVFYNRDGITALDMLVQKAADKYIPLGIVEMLPDMDIPADLASLIPVLRALQLAEKYDPAVAAPRRTLKILLDDLGLDASAPPPQSRETAWPGERAL